MAELINMPRAAWKRQPTGLLKPNYSSSVFNTIKPMALFAPVGNTIIDLMGVYSVESWLSPGMAACSSGVGAYTPTKGDLEDTQVGPCWRSNLFPSTSVKSFFNYYQLLGNVTNAAYLINGSHSGTTGRRLFVGAGGLTTTNKIMYGYGDTFFDSSTIIPTPVANELHLNGLSITGSTLYGYYDGRTLASSSYTWTGGEGVRGLFLGSRCVNKTTNDFAIIATVANAMLYTVVGSGYLDGAGAMDLYQNPWQLFAKEPSLFYLIPSSGATTQTVAFSVDALIQRAGLTQSTSIDALLQSAFSRSLSLDSLIAAVQAETISLDALLQIVGTRTVSVDALLQATKTGAVSVDALLQATLSQALSLDALIQAIQSAGLSLDALLSKPMTVASVMDALIQAAKTGTVSLDAIITVASATTVFVGLDALIQAIQAKTISLDALLQKSYTSPLALDAYVALTQVKTMSLDALLQSTKSGVISLDAILQMTKTAMVSFDALIQSAKTGVISLDAILVFATQASVLLDAYVQKTLSAGVGLDAIIGAIADMILPTGRVITVPASDRFVFVTHSDRVIQIQ